MKQLRPARREVLLSSVCFRDLVIEYRRTSALPILPPAKEGQAGADISPNCPTGSQRVSWMPNSRSPQNADLGQAGRPHIRQRGSFLGTQNPCPMSQRLLKSDSQREVSRLALGHRWNGNAGGRNLEVLVVSTGGVPYPSCVSAGRGHPISRRGSRTQIRTHRPPTVLPPNLRCALLSSLGPSVHPAPLHHTVSWVSRPSVLRWNRG
jgi:hypothetical protein